MELFNFQQSNELLFISKNYMHENNICEIRYAFCPGQHQITTSYFISNENSWPEELFMPITEDGVGQFAI